MSRTIIVKGSWVLASGGFQCFASGAQRAGRRAGKESLHEEVKQGKDGGERKGLETLIVHALDD
jgi:hypothetical protein